MQRGTEFDARLNWGGEVADGYLMAIDAGSGSCRAIVFSVEGQHVSSARREWTHPPLRGVPNSQVFDTEQAWQNICACIQQAIQNAGVSSDAILAVSSTSMREGMVLYDAFDREIWACPNADARAATEANHLVETGLAKKMYSICGNWVSLTAPPRLHWIRRHQPDTFSRVRHVTMLGDWIAFKLCGEYATDPSLGSSSGMFDLTQRRWSDEIIGICEMQPSSFPSVRESGSILGGVHREGGAASGLRVGTPVIVGGADTQLGLVGLGEFASLKFTIIGGTFWQHTVNLDSPFIDPDCRLHTHCHTVPGRWMMEGVGFYSGLAMRWFRDGFYFREKSEAQSLGVDTYTTMEREAASVPPGANGVLGLFSNWMDAKRWVHATPTFMQFDIRNPHHSGRKECVRAIEESAAYVSRGHLGIVESLFGSMGDRIFFAGGAAQGQLWPQILADVLNRQVLVPSVKESTALGAAMYAGLGVGIYRSLSDAARQVIRIDTTFEPNSAAHSAYLEFYEQWLQVYRISVDLVERGLVRPLWRAPGVW